MNKKLKEITKEKMLETFIDSFDIYLEECKRKSKGIVLATPILEAITTRYTSRGTDNKFVQQYNNDIAEILAKVKALNIETGRATITTVTLETLVRSIQQEWRDNFLKNE